VDYILAIIALVVGAVGGFFIAHFKSKSESSRLEERNANLDEQLNETEAKLEQLQQEKEVQLKEEREKSAELDRQLAGLKSEYSSLQEKLADQKNELS
jgi:DNA recombination protein RmuC